MTNELSKLAYSYDALEPYIDAKTVEIHYSKHHQGYLTKLLGAIAGTDLETMEPEEILQNLSKIPENIKGAVVNNAGGVVNHNIYWQVMGPQGAREPLGTLGIKIDNTFGNFENFKEQFTQTAATLFGSGWTWLVLDGDELKISTTQNQNSPLSLNQIPIIGLDVWEHAYYLKYQNKRPEYILNWWNVLNWEEIESIYAKAMEHA